MTTSPRLGLLVVLAGLIALFSFASDFFFTALTFRTILNQLPPLVMISVGMTFVLVSAQIDLSVGSVLAFCGALFGVVVVDSGLPMLLAVPLAILCGLLCGLANG